ncbi:MULTISPECIES: phosphatase PAP2 family protein [Dehalococcoides]|uniref:phosphatase PAP2 family protein n=1 Tax=Dehalococcoides TaxID=61434 RepID=UPI0002B7645E|nr:MULTISPECIES: phosphatase PAP2 family protein [Dehalococcoides]AGG06846.1 PAP2 family protein [Dehalococcoides mccartyi DCMB5]AGG08341.1 PAP2 family protein [Dehalococcoides mccartyi BTF08]
MAKLRNYLPYLILLGMFGLLAWLVYLNPVLGVDTTVSGFIQGISLPGFDGFMGFISRLGNFPAWVISPVAAVIWLWCKGYRLQSVICGLVPAVTALIVGIYKSLIDRPRPYGLEDGGTSFPSGHTAYALACYGVIFFLIPRFIRDPLLRLVLRLVCLVPIFFMGISRIYLNAHWPSDVLASYLLAGAVLGIGLTYLRLRLAKGVNHA